MEPILSLKFLFAKDKKGEAIYIINPNWHQSQWPFGQELIIDVVTNFIEGFFSEL